MPLPILAAAGATAVGLAADAVTALIKKYIPNPEDQTKLELDVFKTLQSSDLAQMAVNAEEAKHSSIFVSGWRPFIGWGCGVAIVWSGIAKPVVVSIVSIFDPTIATVILNVPDAKPIIWELITAMLGLGGMRSFEKLKGVAK